MWRNMHAKRYDDCICGSCFMFMYACVIIMKKKMYRGVGAIMVYYRKSLFTKSYKLFVMKTSKVSKPEFHHAYIMLAHHIESGLRRLWMP